MIDLRTISKGIEDSCVAAVPGVSNVLIENLCLAENGSSNGTIFFDARWEAKGHLETESLVLRSQLGRPALFYDTDLFLQWDVQRAMDAHSDIPVPPLIWAERDSRHIGFPFFVMKRVLGSVPPNSPNYHLGGWVKDLYPSNRKALVVNGLAVMAKIHRLDWANGFQFLERDLPGELGLDRYLTWVEEWAAWVNREAKIDTINRALHYMRAEQPAVHDFGVLWGDPRIGNMVFDETLSVAGVLDWEMAALGPVELDVAWWLMFEDLFTTLKGVKPLEGIPSREEFVSHYEALMDKPLRNLGYYETISWLRLLLTCLRMEDKRIHVPILSVLEERLP